MHNYDAIEEKVLELVWEHSPQERDFMIEFLSKVFSAAQQKFSTQQKEIFNFIMNSRSDQADFDENSIKEKIEQNCRSAIELKGSEHIEVYAAKFLFSLHELIFEYSETELEYPEKQSDMIENFTCAYENIRLEPYKLDSIVSQFYTT